MKSEVLVGGLRLFCALCVGWQTVIAQAADTFDQQRRLEAAWKVFEQVKAEAANIRLTPRLPIRERKLSLVQGQDWLNLHIKFRDEGEVRLRGQRFTSRDDLGDKFNTAIETANSLIFSRSSGVGKNDIQVGRTFGQPEAQLDLERSRYRGDDLYPDLNSFFTVTFPLVSTEFSSRISGSATTAIVGFDPALGMAVELV